MRKSVFIAGLFAAFSCSDPATTKTKPAMQTNIPVIIQYDAELEQVIDTSLKPQVIAEGYEWSEGPLWLEASQQLLFSDVPRNTVYAWSEEKGVSVYLQPSGYTGREVLPNKEPGSNGLTLDPGGRLVLCQHGNRQLAFMDAPLDHPAPVFQAIATHYNGKRFSSPNDCVFSQNGELYFTDPPYGLSTQDDRAPEKEVPFNGVYKVKKNREVLLLAGSISRPNGLAFLPGERQLIVACSDPDRPVWYLFDVEGDRLVNERLFYDASGYDPSWNGLPDGLKVNRKGYVFATGPGGVYIFNGSGKKLGLIHTRGPASNCALDAAEKTLFVTNDNDVLKISLK